MHVCSVLFAPWECTYLDCAHWHWTVHFWIVRWDWLVHWDCAFLCVGTMRLVRFGTLVRRAAQRALAARVGRAKRDLRLVVPSPELYAAVRAVAYGDAKGMFGAQKRTRSVTQGKIMSRVMEVVGAAFPGTPPLLLRIACDQVVQEALRDRMLEAGTPAPRAPPGSLVSGVGSRPDGRDSRTVRPVSGAVGLLPRAHGSSLFTRGSTQVLVATTLGDPDTGALSVQAPTGLGASRRSFYLHYDFPPYCTNEVGKPGMNRRMVGHGALAERALAGVVMPPGPGGAPSAFPYAVRVSSEVTASDGSSSMATVCGATLALQDAGVPLAAPVAGVSIGLVTPRDMAADRRYLLLTDILGLEDHVGDMDFKVAGTAAGVTAIQLDVKLEGGLPLAILEDALGAARTARVAVLGAMTDVIAASRAAPRATAPRTERVTLEASSRGILVNNFSAVLRRLQVRRGCGGVGGGGHVAMRSRLRAFAFPNACAAGRDGREDGLGRALARRVRLAAAGCARAGATRCGDHGVQRAAARRGRADACARGRRARLRRAGGSGGRRRAGRRARVGAASHAHDARR